MSLGVVLPASFSAYKMARLTKNLHSVMGAVLNNGPLEYRNGAFRLRSNWKGGGFESIFTDIAERGELDLWQGYAIATRAKRLMAEGRENLLTEQDIAVLLDHPAERLLRFSLASKRWAAFNKAMLDMAEAAGLLNPEQRVLWENEDYVPFYRLLEEDAGVSAPGNKRGLANQRSGIRALKGGEAQLNDIIENMVMNLTHLVDASMKNVAAQRVIEMLDEGGMTGEVITPVGMEFAGALTTPEQAARALENIGVQVEGLTAKQRQEWLTVFSMRPPTAPDVISVMIDGKPKFYRVDDPMLLASLTSLGAERVHWIMKVLGAPKRWLTTGITAFPGFMIRNFLRDSLATPVVTDAAIGATGALKGFVKALRRDESLISIMAGGGGSGGFYRTEPDDVRKMLHATLKEGGKGGVLLDTPRKAWEAWQRIGHAAENANRIAVYEAVLKDTGDEAEAAFQAMDLLDFSMRGDAKVVQFLIQTIPFLNPRAQGLYRMGRGAKANPKRFLLYGGMIMAATLALQAANDDDERYNDLPDYEKDAYYHIFLDNIFPKAALDAAGIDASGWHLKLPKPFEVGAIFSTIPEHLWRWAKGQEDGAKVVERMGAMVRDTFAVDWPQFMRPLIEQGANKIGFTGSPIVSERLKALQPEAQFEARTSRLARLIADAMPDAAPEMARSPVRIEALARGYFGTLGTHLMAAGDVIGAPFYDKPEAPALRLDQIPEIGTFFREHPAASTRWVTEFYDTKQEIEALAATVRSYQKTGRIEDARQLIEQDGRLGLTKFVQRQGRIMSNINANIRATEESNVLTPEEKRQRIDDLYAKRNTQAKAAINALKRLEDNKEQ